MRALHVVLRSACVMGAVVALTRPVGEPARVTAVARGGAVITGLNGKPPLSACLLYTSPSPRDRTRSRMPSSA